MAPATNRLPRLLALMVATALAFSGCAYSLVNAGQINQAKAAQIRKQIQVIRQLSFKREVPMVLRTPEQVRKILVAEMKEDYTDEQLKADGEAGAMLGLYPQGINLENATVSVLDSQIAAFYDPDAREMVLVKGALKLGFLESAEQFAAQRDVVGEMLLAHELTHALQDQNFAVSKKLDSMRNNSDRALALKSVAEGDATIAGFACVVGRMDYSVADLVAGSLKKLPRIFAAEAKGTPEGIGTPLVFQYSQGVRFVAEAYRRGGWKAIDKLYTNPPESSQQIIEPALYFDHFTSPVKVGVAGYQPILRGWKEIDRDTYGELLLKIILRRNFGKNAPEVALARRWAGDKLVVLGRGAEVTALWLVVFRDSDSAVRFSALYAPLLDRTLGAATPHGVQPHGDAVLIVTGDAARHFKQLAPAIWKASTLGKPAPLPVTDLRTRAGMTVEDASVSGASAN